MVYYLRASDLAVVRRVNCELRRKARTEPARMRQFRSDFRPSATLPYVDHVNSSDIWFPNFNVVEATDVNAGLQSVKGTDHQRMLSQDTIPLDMSDELMAAYRAIEKTGALVHVARQSGVTPTLRQITIAECSGKDTTALSRIQTWAGGLPWFLHEREVWVTHTNRVVAEAWLVEYGRKEPGGTVQPFDELDLSPLTDKHLMDTLSTSSTARVTVTTTVTNKD